MQSKRLHDKVFVWWGRWWAVQIVTMIEISFGFAVHWRRPMLDIYLGPVTLAVGRIAAMTDGHERLRSRCRGFFIGEAPTEVVW